MRITSVLLLCILMQIKLQGQELRKSKNLDFTNKITKKDNGQLPSGRGTHNVDYGESPNWRNVEQFGGTGSTNGRAVTTDDEGRTYVFGEFTEQIIIDDDTLNGQAGIVSTYVAKYDNAGSLVWLKPGAMTDNITGGLRPTSIVVKDDDESIFISGSFESNISAGSFDRSALGDRDIFFAKLDSEGNFLMLKTYGELDRTFGWGNLMFHNDNLYFKGSSHDLLKFDITGNLVWSQNLPAAFWDFTIYEDHIYATGDLDQDSNFGGTVLNHTPNHNAYLFKMDLDGVFQWAIASNSLGLPSVTTSGYRVLVDNLENVYVIGEYENNVSWESELVDDGSAEGKYIVKCDNQGNVIWLKSFPGSSPLKDAKLYEDNIYISVENNGMKFHKYDTAGAFISSSPLYFDYSYGYTLTNDGVVRIGELNRNSAVIKTDIEFNQIWENKAQSKAGSLTTIGLDIDSLGNSYIFGMAEGTNQFGNITLEGDGVYLIKRNAEGSILWSKHIQKLNHSGLPLGNRLKVNKKTGDVLITAEFSDEIKIDGTTISPGGEATLIAKFSTSGTLRWTRVIEGGSRIDAVALDSENNAIISGTFDGQINMVESTYQADILGDVFILKINDDGYDLWARHLAGDDAEYLAVVSLDGNDNIFLAGEFYSRSILYTNFESVELSDTDGNNILWKFDKDGNYQWSKAYAGGEGNLAASFPTGIKTDPNGYSYVTGFHADGLVFGDTTLNINTGFTYSKYVCKFSPSGDFEWVRSIQERSLGYMYNELDIDSDGNVYVASDFTNTIDFEQDVQFENTEGERYVFYARYSSDGDLDWVKDITSENSFPTGMAVIAPDNLLVSGHFETYLDYELGEFITTSKNGYVGVLCTEPEAPEKPVGQSTICIGEGFSQYNLPNTYPTYSYNWSLTPSEAGTMSPEGNEVTINWNIDFSGEASLTAQASNYCSDGQLSEPLLLSVFEDPIPTIEQDKETLRTTEGDDYQWYFEEESIEGANSQSYTASEFGNYTVEVTYESGCVVGSDIFTYESNITGTDDEILQQIGIFPNPVNESLNLHLGTQMSSNIQVSIRDMIGKELIIKNTVLSSDESNTYSLDVSSLKKGVYLIEINTDLGKATHKFLKE